jgi:sec-independent protein translocase protein TatC
MATLRRTQADDDKRMELTEHLGELRVRLMRSLWYLVIGAIVAYQFFSPLYMLLYRPLDAEVKKQNAIRLHKQLQTQNQEAKKNGEPILIIPYATHNPPTQEEFNQLAAAVRWIHEHPAALPQMSGIVFKNFHEMFMVRLTISILFGFILVLPLVIRELALFITPALTPQERKPLRMLVPLSIFLLIFGVAIAYCTMFYAMGWFLSYLDDFPQPASLMQDPHDYVVFFAKMMAAFGIAFQLPVLLMGCSFVGIVTSKGLIKHWRWGVMIAFLGGVLTPANDPMSWMLMVVPLLLLYCGSILLVKFVERIKARQKPA